MSSNVPVHINSSGIPQEGSTQKGNQEPRPCDVFAVVAECVSSITLSTVVFLVDVRNYYRILRVSNLVTAVPLIIFPSSCCGLAVLFNLRGTVISKVCLCNYCYSDCVVVLSRELTSFREETSFDSRFHRGG